MNNNVNKVITANGLTKEYTRYEKEEGFRGSVKSLFRRKRIVKTAVRDFDLEIAGGEFVGVIGPNGAGKTTLMKMLTGIISPTRGTANVLGYVPNELKNSYKKQFAIVMGQKSQLFHDISASDTFLLLKEMYEVEENEYRSRLAYFTELFDAKDFLNVPVRTLSLGERMKMELIAALLHGPKILFLDEPTIGLDVVAQKQIRGFLKEINRDIGTTILLTSHYMDDIKSLCKRCIVINEGTKIYDGSLDLLFDRFQTHKAITVSFTEATDYRPPFDVRMVEENPFRLSFLAHRNVVRNILGDIMSKCDINDISIEAEDIGIVVERIYNSGNGTSANESAEAPGHAGASFGTGGSGNTACMEEMG